jgi:HK97 family phage major capsid protein
MNKLQELQEQRQATYAKAKAITDAAEAEERELTDEQQAKVDGLLDEVDDLDKQIDAEQQKLDKARQRKQRLEGAEQRAAQPVATKSAPNGSAYEVPDDARIGPMTDRREYDPKAGFNHVGEFAMAVRNHCCNAAFDDRLNIVGAPTNVSNTGVGSDGGFAVPDEFNNTLFRHAFNEASLLPRTRRLVVSGNSITIPTDEDEPWSSNGVQVYWTAEASQVSDSKVNLNGAQINLHDLTALAPVSNDLLEDSGVALEPYLNSLVPDRIRYKVDDAIVNGDGAGKPLGILESGAIVSVSRGTTNATVTAANVANMYARSTQGAMLNGLWLHHPSVMAQFIQMTVSNQPVFTPPGGINNAPFGQLLGRPIVPHDACQKLGDKGDVYLLDPSQYVTITKGRGIDSQMSIHLYFDRNISTFRFNFRVGGQPWMDSTISPDNGTDTRSPFVTLATS